MVDSKEILICPACGKETAKVYISSAGINVDICIDGCGGIIFDNRELEKCDETHENVEEVLESVKGRTFDEVDTSLVRICPVCEADMVKIGSEKGFVEIDCCYSCGTKFLDHGELDKIRNAKKEKIPEHIEELVVRLADTEFEEVTLGLPQGEPSPFRKASEKLVNFFILNW